ncbi:hypothetical protein CMO94_03920 [Candidatus Woesearchaeota archaeon]|jgi:hypothetical protein|nr:hypothetical protein [Candidatus Woesearchaeota archaeon]|tara:strand:- start:1773 stop:2420 length:648 start_codon:yes stop_codon:yes gene_type:complete
MTNTTNKVYNFLIKNPDITKNLQKGLINTRALAILIMKQEQVNSSVHAVISAIRRYETEEKNIDSNELKNLLKQCRISTKSRLNLITLSRDFSFLIKTFPLLLSKINPSIGELLRVVEGRASFKILIDQSKKKELLSLIEPSKITSIVEDLAEINVLFSKEHVKVRGMMASILNELAIKNIQVFETISCLPEFIVVVKEKDIGKTHTALLTFFYE